MAASRTELPLTHELLPSLNDTRLLYVALFLHDIAKGRPEDHSIAGARIARKFCPRLGLDAAETDTVAWLIQYHLVMSEIAQARDLQDPETASAFADIVQSPQRLALLMILTACDIRAVGPGRLDRLEGLAAALALLRHRAAALRRPFARYPVRPHRRAPSPISKRRSSPGRGPSSRPTWRATTITTGCAPSSSCSSSTPR